MKFKSKLVLLIFTLFLSLNTIAYSQTPFISIPNYVGNVGGVEAGHRFRNDINNHLSGVSPISPSLASMPVGSLPTELDGQLLRTTDGVPGSVPCTSGGTGAYAFGLNGKWTCLPQPLPIFNISSFSASDIGAEINLCVTKVLALNSFGGACDVDENFATNGIITTPIVVKPGVLVQLEYGQYKCGTGSTACFTYNEGAKLKGRGRWVNGGTKIMQTNGQNGNLIHGVASDGSSDWIHWSELGDFVIDGDISGNSSGDNIYIDRCGEAANIHDIYTRNAAGDGIHFHNSQAGCGGIQNMESASNGNYGLELDHTSSRMNFDNITGDNNVHGIVGFTSATNVYTFSGLKSESITDGTNDPAITINDTTGQEIGLDIVGGHFAGHQDGTGSCVGVNGTQAYNNISCDLIKIIAGQAIIHTENVDATAYLNWVNDTTTSGGGTQVTEAEASGNPDFNYSSDRGAVAIFAAGVTGADHSRAGQMFADQIELANGIYGSIAIQTVPIPAAPTLAGAGSTGGSNSHTYYCASWDAAGTMTGVSSGTASSTIQNLSIPAEVVTIECPRVAGAAWEGALKDATTGAALVGKVQTGTMLFGNDSFVEIYDGGQSLTSVTTPTTNTTGSLTIAANLNTRTLDNIQMADQYLTQGLDPGQAVLNCIAAAQAVNAIGGICDMSGFTNSPTILTPIVVPPGITLIAGNGTYNCHTGASDCIQVQQNAQLLCKAPHGSSLGCYFKQANAQNGNVIHAINSAGNGSKWQNSRIDGITVNGNGTNQTTAGDGILVDNCGSGSTITNVLAFGAFGAGLHLEHFGGECGGGDNISSNTNGTYGIEFDDTSNAYKFSRLSLDNNTTSAIGIVNGTTGSIDIDGLGGQVTAATPTSDPYITIAGSTGQQLSLKLNGVAISGLSTAGACAGVNTSAVPSNVTCDFIKITGGQSTIEMTNSKVSNFVNVIHNTSSLSSGQPNITPDMMAGNHLIYSNGNGADLFTTANSNAASAINAGLTILNQISSVNGYYGDLKVHQIAAPGAPTVTGPGSSGGSTSHTYYCAALSAGGKPTPPSTGTVKAAMLDPLTQTNYALVSCPRVAGASQYAFLKDGTTGTVLLGQLWAASLSTGNDQNIELYDYGQSLTAYTGTTNNTTGYLRADAAVGVQSITVANLANLVPSDGDQVPVNDWNGTPGTCVGGGSSANVALYSSALSAWKCNGSAAGVIMQTQGITNTKITSDVTPITAATFTTILSITETTPNAGTTWAANFSYNVNAQQIATAADEALVCYVTDGTNIFVNSQSLWRSSTTNIMGASFSGLSIPVGASLITYPPNTSETFTLKCANSGANTWTAKAASAVSGGQNTSMTLSYQQQS